MATGIAGGLLVAGAIHYLTGSGKTSTQHQAQPLVRTFGTLSQEDKRLGYGERDLGIAYGSTPKQVLRQLGAPTRKQGDCWLYSGQVGKVRGRDSGDFVDAMKFCFTPGPLAGDTVGQIFSHYVAHTIVMTDPVTHTVTRKNYPPQWGQPIDIAKVPSWYVQENS